MYTIGQFASIVEVSTKTLRYYDDIDIFKPKNIDENNNYRYYVKEQIGEFQTIKELKEYGLALLDIKKIISSNNKLLKIEILKKQLNQIEKKIKNLLEIKKTINNEIKNPYLIKRQNTRNYDIELIELEFCYVTYIRERIKLKNLGNIIGKLYEQVNKNSIQIQDNKHKVIIHEIKEDEFSDVEVFLNVNNKNKNYDSKFIKKFKGGKYIKTTHKGFLNKCDAYSTLYDFAIREGYEVEKPIIEEYIINKQSMEINIMFNVRGR